MSAIDFERRSPGDIRVYVSGPYTSDPLFNTHRAIVAGNKILDAGLVPFVPHLSHFWHTYTPRDYRDWMKIDLAFLPACDVVLRLPGHSPGADEECAFAEKLGIPVRSSIEEIVEEFIVNGERVEYR